MARKRLAAAVVAALTLPLSAIVMPASKVVAAPTPQPGSHSDIRHVTRTPNLLDGKPLPVPNQNGQRARSESNASGPPAVTPPIGTVRQWVGLDDVSGTFYRKNYTLRGVGRYIEAWVANDLEFPEGDCRKADPRGTTVTDAQIATLIDEFDRNIYPKETAAFSTPPNRDGSNAVLKPEPPGEGGVYTGDGAKTVTLIDNIRDTNFYHYPEATSYIAGFFSANLTEALDRNIMTIDAFDWIHRTTANPPDEPTEELCTSYPSKPRLYEGVFAHEWQHLLHHYTDPMETTWLNEGLSDFAVELVGYANTTATIFEPAPDRHLTCFQGYGTVQTRFNPNPSDCGGPQNSLTLWGEGDDEDDLLADYGNAFSFVLFLYDRYGLDIVSKLHKDGSRQGIASLEAELKSVGAPEAYSVIHDYQTMTLVDRVVGDSRAGVMRGVPRSRVTTKSLRSDVNLDNPQAYQAPGAAPNGVDYVLLREDGRAIPGRDLRSVAFTGVKSLPPLPLAWTVISHDPDRAGNPVLFSGNANYTDAAMVTSVTVPTSDPTLRFLAKYGAEEDYDYGYVAVSTDGGTTYTPIAGDKTVTGPLGPGLNGATLGFQPHSFDLSAYAGQRILLSIRYVSDGGVNDGGLLVDDLTVGERVISDGSTLDPFDSPTEIRPVAVHRWNLRLVGIDETRHVAHQFAFDGQAEVRLNCHSDQLRILRRFPKVVAIVGYDEPTEQIQQYAPYSLTVNGVSQPGGAGP